jgi:short-subunit dehydrogenase
MKMGFKNKTILITGSSKGIGRTLAAHLCEKGANVVLNGRREDELNATFKKIQNAGHSVRKFQGDVAEKETCNEMIQYVLKEFGSLDILVNNVGVGSRGLISDTKDEVWTKLLNANLMSSIYTSKAALGALKKSKGSIVFVSTWAAFRGLPNRSVYGASKMAQASFADSLRAELSKDKVHVGLVYLGPIINDPDKMIISSNDKQRTLKDHKNTFAITQDAVAIAIMKCISKRKSRLIVGIIGKLYSLVVKLFPFLLDYILRKKLSYITERDN